MTLYVKDARGKSVLDYARSDGSSSKRKNYVFRILIMYYIQFVVKNILPFENYTDCNS